ncbi:MAG: sporulation protein YqfD, partial [Clostridia bacterium]|nr:sporulation protein YqfD [Clostridia bacterium]
EKMTLNEHSMTLRLSLPAAKKLIKMLEKSEIEFESDFSGFPFFAEKYKKRLGILAGAGVIIFFASFSSSHVWDIRVSGNKRVSEAQVEEELAEAGFYIGSRIGERDVDEIAGDVLLGSPNIAWMSINMRGNVAYVDIREKEQAERGDTLTKANIVASADGIIEYAEVMRGSLVAFEGQSVREGDLLISGVSESKNGEIRIERALGKVYAITNRSFFIKIPLEYEKKILSEPLCTKKTIKFFSKYINIFRKGGNLGASCVKIEEEDSFSVFGLPALPISVISELSSSYELRRVRRSEKEASELAFFELEKLILSELSDADLLKKTVRTEIGEKEFLLWCDVICSENIARSVPILEEGK